MLLTDGIEWVAGMTDLTGSDVANYYFTDGIERVGGMTDLAGSDGANNVDQPKSSSLTDQVGA
jgi:hypothetical protein